MLFTRREKLNRVRRMVSWAIGGFIALLFVTLVSGYFIYTEITTSYSTNYHVLSDAGFSDLLIAPQIISDHMLLILTLMPVLGVLLVCPFLFLSVSELHNLIKEKDAEIEKYKSTSISID